MLLAQNGWNEARTTHFIIYYKNAPDNFIEELKGSAEDYYNTIADDLGFRRYNFWLWENRAKIYIYDDIGDFQRSTLQPTWAAGAAMTKDKVIHTFPNEQGFFDTILPHELGHIIFREFVGFDNSAIPYWLDEGVASFQENVRRKNVNRLLRDALSKGILMGIEQLSVVNPQSVSDQQLANLYYAEALGVVNFLIQEYGSDTFVKFCQELRDRKDLAQALRVVYSFESIQQLDEAWQKYLSHG